MAKLETQILDLHARLSSALTDTTTCDYTAVLRHTLALEQQAKQLEASLPPKPPL